MAVLELGELGDWELLLDEQADLLEVLRPRCAARSAWRTECVPVFGIATKMNL